MNLDNVRRKTWVIDQLPGIGRGTCHAVYPNIYLSRKVYSQVFTDKPDTYAMAVVIHEQEHLNRMKSYGVAKWYIRYLWSGSFRLEEELAATKPQFSYIKAQGLTFNLERKAHLLSGWLYLWAGKYQVILDRLTAIWKTS